MKNINIINFIVLGFGLIIIVVGLKGGLIFQASTAQVTTLEVALGRQLFFEPTLSTPIGQSCASCHDPHLGYANNNIVSAGADVSLFGSRNTPSISYAAFSPRFFYDKEEKTYIGGLFWDGRVSTLEKQIEAVLFNPLEMGNKDKISVVSKVRRSNFSQAFEKLFGQDIWNNTDQAFRGIAYLLAAYERSSEVSPFTSKYDYYLRGKVQLTIQEKKGLEIFEAKEKGNCAACHPSKISDEGDLPLFTDHSYDNIGLPRSQDLRFYDMGELYNPSGRDYIDSGLANNFHIIDKGKVVGKFKVPTLRNIGKTAPYMHNGSLDTLEAVVDFYNNRDVKKKWAIPEVSKNINKDELGNLELSSEEVSALIAFLNTLNDGFVP